MSHIVNGVIAIHAESPYVSISSEAGMCGRSRLTSTRQWIKSSLPQSWCITGWPSGRCRTASRSTSSTLRIQFPCQLGCRSATALVGHALRVTRTMRQRIRCVQICVRRDPHTETLNQLTTEPAAEQRCRNTNEREGERRCRWYFRRVSSEQPTGDEQNHHKQVREPVQQADPACSCSRRNIQIVDQAEHGS